MSTPAPGGTKGPQARRGWLRRYRLLAVATVGATAVLLGALLFGNLNQSVVYFLTPAEAVAQQADYPDGRRFQLGGLVRAGSVTPTTEGVRFTVASATGSASTVPVDYRGAPAQLFAAGIGVVIEGSWRDGTFEADSMKVKHDENYRPPAEAP